MVTSLLVGDGEEGYQLSLCSLTAAFLLHRQEFCTLLKSMFGLVRQGFLHSCIVLDAVLGFVSFPVTEGKTSQMP